MIGLTGTIGSGKSTALATLKRLGATCIDADAVGHRIYLPGTPTHARLVSIFGERVVNVSDGTINRRALGALVFADEKEMARLNAAVWPAIADRIRDRIDAARICAGAAAQRLRLRAVSNASGDEKYSQSPPSHTPPPPPPPPLPSQVVVVEAAVLDQAGWGTAFCDEVWRIKAPLDDTVARLQATRGMPETKARAITESQSKARQQAIEKEEERDRDASAAAEETQQQQEKLRVPMPLVTEIVNAGTLEVFDHEVETCFAAALAKLRAHD